MSKELQLWVRLAVLGTIVTIVQITAISQVPIFGVTVDVLPLVVMSVGLLAGSIPGAVTGFAIGLLVDVSLLQTLGVSSLIYIVIGYGAGRFRELRDPSHALVPLAVGIIAATIASVGYSLMQFLLGVDAPVSLLLIRQIFVTIVLSALVSLPVYAVVRRWLSPVLPEDPRRRKRRAYTTGGLSPLSRS